MSDIDTLRNAVTKLRELAGAATPGPWTVAHVSGQGFAVHRGEHTTVSLYSDRPDAEFIATLDPDLALLLADWLDTAGADLWEHEPLCEYGSGCYECDDDLRQPHARRALAVARKVLS